MQSVPITNKVVSSNPAHVEVYSAQPYVIKFVSVLRWFTPVTSTNKTEILLKLALSIITLTHFLFQNLITTI